MNEMLIPALKALADPTRFHIVEFLSRSCCGKADVCDNCETEGPTAGEVCCHITGLEKINSTVSHHLHELNDAGLIHMEKRGKTCVCTLRSETFLMIAEAMKALAQGETQNDCC